MKTIFILMIPVLVIMGCKRNQAPVISGLECTPEIRNAGTVFTLKALVSDQENDLLTYQWKAGEGSFTTATDIRQVSWKSPVDGAGKTCTISVEVSDGENVVTSEIKILLDEPELGNLKGHVTYTNFNIPIGGATISAGDKSALTDNDGNYELSGILAGECVLTAAKELFTSSIVTVQVPVNGTLTVPLEITAVSLTTKLSGMVSDPDGKPLENVKLTVLNPDGSESKLKATTNAAGFYRLWYIPFGTRTLIATKPETKEIRYLELEKQIEFVEVETQLNLTLQQILLKGQFTDPRDNHIYPYTTFGNHTWMTENLSYLPKVGSSATGSSQEAYYYVYDYQGTDVVAAKATDNYKMFGVLYNWPAAMKACPTGWHLPTSDLEWDELTKLFAPKPGKKLKSVTVWADHGGGDNSSGFSALPGGEVTTSGEFSEFNYNGYYWTASKASGSVLVKVLSTFNDEVFSRNSTEKLGVSVRCVKNN